MSQLIFPTNPVDGQTYVGANNITYTYKSNPGVWSAPSTPSVPTLNTTGPFQSAPQPFYIIGAVGNNPYSGLPNLAVGDDEMVVWGADTLGEFFYRSTDGINWTKSLSVPLATYGQNAALQYGGNGTYLFWPSVAGQNGFRSTDGGVSWSSYTFPVAAAGDPTLLLFLGCPGAAGDPAARFMLAPVIANETGGLPSPARYTVDGGNNWQTTNVPLVRSSFDRVDSVANANAFTFEGYDNVPRYFLNAGDAGSPSGGSVGMQVFDGSSWQVVAVQGAGFAAGMPYGKVFPFFLYSAFSPSATQIRYWIPGIGSSALNLTNPGWIPSGGTAATGFPGWTGPNNDILIPNGGGATSVLEVVGGTTLEGTLTAQSEMPSTPGASTLFKGKYFWYTNGGDTWYAPVETL